MNSNLDKDILDLIYLAAGCPAYWADCLEVISKKINAKSGMIGSDNLTTGEHLGRFQFNMDTEFVKRIASDLRFCDLWTKSLTELKPDHFVTEQTFSPQKESDTTDFFLNVLKQIDVNHTIGTFVGERGSVGTRIAFQRCAHVGPYGPTELLMLNRLLPHLQQGVAIGALASPYARFTELSLAAIEQSSRSQILLGRFGNIIIASQGAEPLFRANHIKSAHGKLNISGLPQTQLQSAVERVLSCRSIESQSQVILPIKAIDSILSSVIISRVHIGYAIFAHVAIESKMAEPSQHLKLNLTSSELIVFQTLAKGLSPDEIANTLNKSTHTVRTQIKVIKKKLNISSTEKLVVLGQVYTRST